MLEGSLVTGAPHSFGEMLAPMAAVKRQVRKVLIHPLGMCCVPVSVTVLMELGTQHIHREKCRHLQWGLVLDVSSHWGQSSG